ncbi:MAG: flagellar biosynthetic protein FliR [Thermoleophilia bacterium]|nr:flagellar biosynthetic protein FliR [Thermoleophilia bacterium]
MEIPLDWAIPQVITFLLVVGRLSGLFLIAPVFSSPMIPGKLKMMMLLMLALTITPIVSGTATAPMPTGIVELLLAMVTEVVMGLALGFSVAIVFSAVQVGASFIDTSIGFSMANIIDPLSNTQATVLGSFYSIMATLIFLSINGLHYMLAAFKQSYSVVGVGQVPDFGRILDNLFFTFKHLFGMGFQIAAPVLITLLLCDVVLGIVSRVVPQMNVFFVGVPLKIGVGLLAIIIALPTFSTFLGERVSDVLDGAGVITGAGRDDEQPKAPSTANTAANRADATGRINAALAAARTKAPTTSSDDAATPAPAAPQTAEGVNATDGR